MSRTRHHRPQAEAHTSPVRIFAVVLVAVFVVELLIMVLGTQLSASRRSGLGFALVDGALLVAALSPALWMLVVRPLRSLVAERGALLAQALRVQEDERLRVARDLHDELGQRQVAALLAIAAAGRAGTLEEARERAEAARELVAGAIESTRRLARGLAPGVLDDLGLQAAVERICEDMQASGSLAVECTVHIGSQRLARSVEIAAYRIVQEALANVARHAQAQRARVAVALEGDCIVVEVSDDGRGLTGGSSGGLGLAGMRERAAALGGSVTIGVGDEGRGTRVRAVMPAEVQQP